MKTKERHQRVARTEGAVPHTDGVWPRVNRELIKDYPRTPDSDIKGVFRIHLDVPIKEKTTFEKLEAALASGNLDGARAILRKEVGHVRPETDAHHAWMMIESALSL